MFSPVPDPEDLFLDRQRAEHDRWHAPGEGNNLEEGCLFCELDLEDADQEEDGKPRCP